eukprot:6135550-Alexandrium_andersonii.AAC.1
MLDGARATDAHPSASEAPSMQAQGKVRVHTHAEGKPFVLPREAVDVPRARDQVPGQPDQRRPVR